MTHRNAMLAILAGVVVAAAADSLWARGEIVEPISPFSLKSYGGDLFFESQYRQENDTRGPKHAKTDLTDLLFREGVDLRGNGYIYHPNLLEWYGSARVGFVQDDSRVGEEDHSSDGVLLGYNLYANLFKQKAISATVFASRSDDIVNRVFADPLKVESSTEGFEMRYRGVFPVVIHYEHHDRREEGNSRVDESASDDVRLDIEDRRSSRFYNHLTYEHEQVSETTAFSSTGAPTISTDLPDQRDEINLTNRWLFGGNGALENQLTGRVRGMHREGFFPNDVGLIEQRLDLQHTRTFSTFYRGLVSSDTTTDQRDQLLEGEVGFHKKIYDSLDIEGYGLASMREFEDGSEDRYGAFLELGYTKRTPVGILFSSLNVAREYDQEAFSSGRQSLRGEAVTLSGISPVALSRPNVIGALSVTNLNRNIPYFEGVDYIVTTLGAITSIARVPSGAIGDGDTVLVDYNVTAATNDTFSRDTVDWRTRLDLRFVPVTLYTQYRLRDETIESGDDPGNLEREQMLLGGAEVHVGPLTVGGEFENHDLRLSPGYEAYRFRSSFRHDFDPTVSLTLSGSYAHQAYRDAASFGLGPGRDFLQTYSANASLSSKLQKNLLLRLEASYYQSQGRQNDSLGKVGPTLTWKFAELDFSLTSWVGRFTQEMDKGTSLFVGVNVKRSF